MTDLTQVTLDEIEQKIMFIIFLKLIFQVHCSISLFKIKDFIINYFNLEYQIVLFTLIFIH
jgi:hypothetical protein